MRARTWFLAVAAAMLLPGATSSLAGQPDPSAKFAAQIAAMAATGGPSTSAVVTRTGTLRFIGTVNKVTTFSGPMLALIEFVQANPTPGGSFYIEFRQTEVNFHGKLGRFDVSIPFLWNGVDPASSSIPYLVAVYAGGCARVIGVGQSVEDAGPCQRLAAVVPEQTIPMPTVNGATTTITVSLTE